MLHDRLSPHALIFVNDASRLTESNMVEDVPISEPVEEKHESPEKEYWRLYLAPIQEKLCS